MGGVEAETLAAAQAAPRQEEPDTPAVHDDNRSSMSSDEAQTGVRNIEAISQTWTRWSLVSAYVGIFLLAFCTSLESQTTINLTVYATSAFSQFPLVATVYVVQGVVNAVIKPPMAKIANVFGRLEAFSFSVFLYVLGYIQMAASNDVKTFASAQIFYSAGFTGLQILQQIFVADTTDLLNRALFSTLPDLPFLVTVWIGAPIAQDLLSHTTWRWGYALWAIVLPAAYLPLALALFMNFRKAKRLGLSLRSQWADASIRQGLVKVWYELDVMGLLLLSAAIALVLIPISLALSNGWQNPNIIAMIVIGCVCFVVFPLWESSSKLAPKAFISLRLLTNRTVLAGCGIGFFYFAVFYTSIQPYFYSYLQVVQGYGVVAAGHITQTFSFTATVSSLAISLIIKYTKHYKYYVTFGSAIYLMGVGLMIRYRVEGSSTAQIVGAQIAVGIGGGMLNVPTQLGVQAAVSHGDVAAATAIFLTLVEIGGAVGAAISGAVWTYSIASKLELYLPADAKSQAKSILGSLVIAQSFPMGSPERIAINQAYQETMNILLIISVCLAIPLIPLSVLLKNYKLDQMDQRVRGRVIGKSKHVESINTPPDEGTVR